MPNTSAVVVSLRGEAEAAVHSAADRETVVGVEIEDKIVGKGVALTTADPTDRVVDVAEARVP